LTNVDTPAPAQDDRDLRAEIRGDLIKRLFAVAISVGAATTLSQMKWVQAGRAPCMPEYQQLSILAAALWATVLSWDGYLISIAKRPLKKPSRFIIDILLVFIYMILLMTSRLLTWWLFLHALIYTLYVIWDRLSIGEYFSQFYDQTVKVIPETVGQVYIGGFKGLRGVSQGPVITIVWWAYFLALYLLNDLALRWMKLPGLNERIVGTTVLVLCGLQLYRQDKTKRYTMRRRVAYAGMLLLASGAYLAWLPIDSTIWNWAGPYIGSASCGP
jgi:hypothetical protein